MWPLITLGNKSGVHSCHNKPLVVRVSSQKEGWLWHKWPIPQPQLCLETNYSYVDIMVPPFLVWYGPVWPLMILSTKIMVYPCHNTPLVVGVSSHKEGWFWFWRKRLRPSPILCIWDILWLCWHHCTIVPCYILSYAALDNTQQQEQCTFLSQCTISYIG